MQNGDLGIRRRRGIIRVALCCGLVATLTHCGGATVRNGQAATAAAPSPTLSLSASPMSVSTGAASLLSWSSTNATGCAASGRWSGNEPTSGSASTGTLSATATYTLTCSGPGGSASQSVTVNVNPVITGGSSCSATSGGLTLRAEAVRSSGISPLLMFFDATGTTSSAVSGNGAPFQDVSYSWSFGDTGASGAGIWTYGSNAGHNSRNAASGAVAAHLYITGGADTSYPVTVTAYDGTNTASCNLGVTAYDASGANGFPGHQTTCVYNSIPGSGCPTGAAQLQTNSLSTALSSAFGSSKRVLFRCGDRFSGSYTIGSNVAKASIGAYGGCENSTSNRPIFQNSSSNTITFMPNNPIDIRIADIDFEDGTRSAVAIGNGGGLGETEITLYNLNCSGMNACYYMNEATQSGLIASTATGMRGQIGSYWNFAANNCLNGSNAANCGGTAAYYPVTYNAILGGSFDGSGADTTSGSGIETFRISACRLCVIANNTFKNANNVGATLKFNSANTYNSLHGAGTWIGQYSEYTEISDNLFTGTSGAQLVEVCPEDTSSDERERFIVVERNIFTGVSNGSGGRQIAVCAVNVTVRSNVFYVTSADSTPPEYGIEVAQRGIEPTASAVEVYNNTCFALTRIGACVGFDGDACCAAAGINSSAYNNLFYNNGTTSTTVVDHGSGNTIGGNTTDSAANPQLINASGSFSLISDFQPTQDYSGGTAVPVWYDALGVAWSPTWSLGALKP